VKKHPPVPPPKLPDAPKSIGLTTHALSQLKEVQAELHERKLEALRLYEPMPHQEEFHSCVASERIVLGGNRGGKTLAVAVEAARAATGNDPHGKYPKEGGNLAIVGRNWPHIGLVIYPILLKAGAFRIVKDKETGQWRSLRPGEDKAGSKPAPPLIPPRMIKETSWVLKNAGYLNKVELTNGWTIWCFSSEGEPPQGYSGRPYLDRRGC
jgi:hypothetical protein